MGLKPFAAMRAGPHPLRVFLEKHAAATRLLYTTDEVQAALCSLQSGLQVVLKTTSPVRADFEWMQVLNEIKAARSLPHHSCLSPQVAWQEAADGTMLSVSLYAGRTVEDLLQQPAADGGWADLNLQQRIEVARDVLAGGVHALIKLRPWLHFDIKPGNIAVMPCPVGGPHPHVTLLDFGAATHIAALHGPQRDSLYPVVSKDHMDVALITRQPGQDLFPYESKQGAREALSAKTDIFTLGLLAYKILLGSQLPQEMDWNSALYQPWDEHQEAHYIAAQQRLARDLAGGLSTHRGTQALLQQLPQDCLQALGRMCHPDPISRAQLQEVADLPFIQQRISQLGALNAARCAAYTAARQQLINMLQDVPGIHLATRPSRHSSSSGGGGGGGSRLSSSSSSQPLLGAEDPPPGAFQRLPRGTNAAREAVAAAKAVAAAASAAEDEEASGKLQSGQAHHFLQQQPPGAAATAADAATGASGGCGPPGFPYRLQKQPMQLSKAQVEASMSSTWLPHSIIMEQHAAGSLSFHSSPNNQDDDSGALPASSGGPPGFSVKQHNQADSSNKPPERFVQCRSGVSALNQQQQQEAGYTAVCPAGLRRPDRNDCQAQQQQQTHHGFQDCPPGFDAQHKRHSHARMVQHHHHQQHHQCSHSRPQHHLLAKGAPPPGRWPCPAQQQAALAGSVVGVVGHHSPLEDKPTSTCVQGAQPATLWAW